MTLQISLRSAEAPPEYVDRAVGIVMNGDATTAADFSSGNRRMLLIMSRVEDGAGLVYDIDPEAAGIEETPDGRMYDDTKLTEADQVAIIPPGSVYGLTVVSETRQKAHIIIEALNFDQLLEHP